MNKGYLVLEDGFVLEGVAQTPFETVGEIVFNTSHSGYEEIVTDPSYYNQIIVFTAPQIGNYGSNRSCWESDRYQCRGIVVLDLQNSTRDREFLHELTSHKLSVLSSVNTRKLTFHLREQGVVWGAIVIANSLELAQKKAQSLLAQKHHWPKDWVYEVSRKNIEFLDGERTQGYCIGIIDYGVKKNIIREIQKRSHKVIVFPARTSFHQINDFSIDGFFLSNGPGNPQDVQYAVETIRNIIGFRPIFAICMGHQLLSLALGGKTYKLKFGHRGSNHPIMDPVLNKIYVAAHNHGYAVWDDFLSSINALKMINLYDQTLAGFYWKEKKILSVQYHPEASPGPKESNSLFDFFFNHLLPPERIV